MASKGKRRVVKQPSNGKSNGHGNGHGPEDAARALKELRTIGGLLVRSSVGLLNGDAADQFVWLGKQIEAHADQGMAALGREASSPARRGRAAP